jgi:DNA-binding NarL/FixJ family response regulator
MPIKVLIVDDHKLFRQGIISLMRTREDLVEVVGEAATASQAIHMTDQLRPDIVLMDVYMPNGDGLQATREIKQRFPQTSVIILTSSEHREHLSEAIRSEASGYLLKDLDAAELFNMVESVAHGESTLTPMMAARILKGFAKQTDEDGIPIEELTEREVAVLNLVATGASNPQIADELFISINTVKTHLRNILDKLQLDNRTQAATYAIEHGIVNTPGNLN